MAKKKKEQTFKTSGEFEMYYFTSTRTVDFYNEVSYYSVERAIRAMDYLNTISNKPITLNIHSYGGAVDAGLALYDTMKASKSPIITICKGIAASMGAVLLGAGKKGQRFATKNSRIMIHQPSGGFVGKSHDMETHAKEIGRMRELLNALISKDTGQDIEKIAHDTLRDYFMTAEEAKEYGIIDRIL